MKRWLKRIRGVVGTALTWAAAWGGVSFILPDYSDVEEYFDRVGEALGLGAPGNRSGNTPKRAVTEGEMSDVP